MTQFIQLFWCIIELWSCAFENFIITICSSLLPTMTVLCLPLNDCPPFWRSSAWDCQACIFMSHHFRVSLNTYLSGLLWFGYLILAVTSKNFWEIHIDNRWQSGFFRLSKLIILSHREPFTICLRCLIIQSMQLFFFTCNRYIVQVSVLCSRVNRTTTLYTMNFTSHMHSGDYLISLIVYSRLHWLYPCYKLVFCWV